jgi:hypothetical protein
VSGDLLLGKAGPDARAREQPREYRVRRRIPEERDIARCRRLTSELVGVLGHEVTVSHPFFQNRLTAGLLQQ